MGKREKLNKEREGKTSKETEGKEGRRKTEGENEGKIIIKILHTHIFYVIRCSNSEPKTTQKLSHPLHAERHLLPASVSWVNLPLASFLHLPSPHLDIRDI